MVVKDDFQSVAQFRKVEMGQDKGLQVDIQVFLCRKNEVIGELDFAVEIITATFWFIMNCIRLCNKEAFVFMLVVAAMQARLSRLAKTARHLMRFGAIMKPHVPAHRNEKHHKGHQKGTDLKQSFFHGRKSTEKTNSPIISFF
jgi:hypothetical protein